MIMTVLEASGKIYKWFSENDSFSLDEDFKKLVMITDHPKRDRAAVLSALKDLKSAELISSSEIDGIEYWILKKSFLAFPQNVSVSPETALHAAELINNFCSMVDNDTDTCDPANLTDDDVKNLIYIAGLFLKKSLDDASGE
jgi:hypothetical protein